MWEYGSRKSLIWVANREKPVTNSSASLRIGRDGNLRVIDGQQNTVWSTNTSGSPNGSIAVLSDDGKFILILLLENSLLVYHWRHHLRPSFGGSKPHWRSGPWDKTNFIGIPEMDADYQTVLTLTDGIQLGTIYFQVGLFRNCNYTIFSVSPTGVLRILCWEPVSGWSAGWEAPKTPCEVYGACGPFGVCQSNQPNLTCRCLKGFVPKSGAEWGKGNWTGGCVRRTELSCGRNSSAINATQTAEPDGFLKLSGFKVPDSAKFLNVWDANECHQQCLNNCSCSGYAYVDGIGCLVWEGNLVDAYELPFRGQDLFLRLANAELGVGDKNARRKIIISLVTILSVAVFSAIIYGFIKCGPNKRVVKQIETSRDTSQPFMWRSTSEDNDPVELPLFDFNSILLATNNFDIETKLGYGPVYKGKLKDGKDVAIKRLSTSSCQGIDEFKNEVMLISKLQHRNLVRLIGCCIEREEKILIYEFMSNKSLDTYLFDQSRKAKLDWTKRFSIITGVAQGLVYLHRDSCLRIIHRDLKVSNILLDEKMNPKISDFGLARMFEGTQDLRSTHRVVGTLGYMAPEYLLGGIYSEKSDVFGFGVLILEIVSGRKVNSFQLDEQHMSLLSCAW